MPLRSISKLFSSRFQQDVNIVGNKQHKTVDFFIKVESSSASHIRIFSCKTLFPKDSYASKFGMVVSIPSMLNP